MMIVDASAAAPMILPDEANRLLAAVEQAFEAGDVMVPQHWRLEVLNLGLVAVRRQRLDINSLFEGLEGLSDYSVNIDGETMRRSWTQTRQLAVKHKLTAYDAAYLELALRTGSPLASFDGDLVRAAESEGVTIVP